MRHVSSLVLPSLATFILGSCAGDHLDPGELTTRDGAQLQAPGDVPTEDQSDEANASPDQGAAGAPPGWMAQVTARIKDASRGFAPDGDDYIGAVPERKLNGRFDASGAHIWSSADPEAAGIALRTVGMDGLPPALGDCQDGLLDPEGRCVPRLEYNTSGATEWWASTAQGFEQGWEVRQRPEGDGPLTIDVAVDGADATVSDAGVWLQGDDGSLLIVNQLAAWDANGVEVPARFVHTADGFSVVVDDAGAVYPIKVDPTYTTADWSVDGVAGDDPFSRVAGAGDVNADGYADVLVGNYSMAVVYVYMGSGSGTSTTAAVTLTGVSNSHFGSAIAAAGDVNHDGYGDVVVGAYNENSSGGAVYVYQGSAAGLTDAAAATMTGSSGYELGYSVAGAGDVNGDGYDDVIAGAEYRSTAYVYQGSATGISTTASTTLTGTSSTDFGYSVSGNVDVNNDGYDDVIVGAKGYSTNKGRVYVYRGSATGVSTTVTSTLTGAASHAYFGWCVAGLGDVDGDGYGDVAVGAPGSSYYGVKGSFSVYPGSATGTSTTASFSVTGASTSNYLGYSVAAAGDVNLDGYSDLVVGEPGYNNDPGQVHVYAGSATGLSAASVSTLDGVVGDDLGEYVSGAGDTNGDGYSDVIAWGGRNGVGAAMVYTGSSTATMSLSTSLVAESDDYLGISLASAGDVNADGYDDIIVGAYGYLAYRGSVFIYDGSSTGLSATASTTLTGSATGDMFGFGVSGAGDVNADGYDDVIVGGYGGTTAYVYNGSATGPSTTPSTTLSGSSYFSYRVSGAGDVNNDGYDDVIVANGYTPIVVKVYYGSATGTRTTGFTTLSPGYYGESVSAAGDVNGDGYGDIVVGCPTYSSHTGEVLIYRGSSSGISTTVAGTLTGTAANQYFGQSVAGAGDVNADGYSDVVVGAYGYGTSYVSAEGRAYVYQGSSSGLATTATTTITGAADNDYLGIAVAGAGDVDGDGYDDVIVGASGYGTNGEIFVYPGSAAGVMTTASTTITGGETLGQYIASAGDLNGDGRPDIVAADPTYNSNAGRVNVYYSSSDADGDGISSTTDCDDADIGAATTAYRDTDGDGYGDAAASAAVCPGTTGYVDYGSDCDDGDAAVNPGAVEICDALDTDEDCSGLADDSDPATTGQATFYADSDGDGYGDTASLVTVCDPLIGYVANATDCDDGNAAVSPAALEACDASDIDEDCNGLADDVDAAATGKTTVYADSDGDGYGGASATFCDVPASGYVATSTDCDDGALGVNPGAVEICDAADTDEDCDGLVDDADPGATGLTTFYADSDSDGYGGSRTTDACDQPTGYVADFTDCEDGDAAINPAATELCDAADIDEDCDGLADDEDPSATGLSTFYADSDGDGYGGTNTGTFCDLPSGYEATATDCNDGAAGVNPGATEICDAADVDEDCDGLADDADPSVTGTTTVYVDADGDGDGGPMAAHVCDAGAGYAAASTDCDDADAAINTHATDIIADGIDEDCDGSETCYVDADGDGYRTSSTVVSADADCADAGEALAATGLDCDDTDARVHGGAEIPGDGIDEDCDGSELCYVDADDDGYRPDATSTVVSADSDCDDAGEATDDDPVGDCDDGDAAYNPLAEEANCADLNDYNCDGSVGYDDSDGDGYAACEDCDDSRTAVNPDGTETCNGRDDDCNGAIDDGATDATAWYPDADSDGYTDSANPVTACTAPDGYAASTAGTVGTDCNDTDGNCHPGATEIPDDGIDQDCDGADATSGDTGDSGDTDTDSGGEDTATGDSDSGNADNGGNGGDTKKGCGCASAPDTSGLAGLLLVGAMVRRRRG